MERNYKIYKYTNPENNKVYIGLTKNTIRKRAGSKKGRDYKHCIHFYNAIQQHEDGLAFFKLEILKDSLTEKEAKYWEDYYIKLYDARNPKKGYNINNGGGTIPQEQRQKISEKMKQNWKEGAFDDKKKPVYCIELDQVFESITEASCQLIKNGVERVSLGDTCRGKSRYCGTKNGKPLHWCFLKDKTDKLIKELKDRPEKIVHKIPVYCIELDRNFESASAAGKELGIDPTSIGRAIRGERQSAGKHPITKERLHWKYTET